MDRKTLDRRDVLKATAAAGAVGLTAGAHAAGPPAYDPTATFDLVVSEVELRRNTAGRIGRGGEAHRAGSGRALDDVTASQRSVGHGQLLV